VSKRLIETCLPIAEIGEKRKRERASAIALPQINYLHVWWGKPVMTSQDMPQLLLIGI
jgi:adenine-specific DNA methylase